MGTLLNLIIPITLGFGSFILGMFIYHGLVDPENEGFSKTKVRHFIWFIFVIGYFFGLNKLLLFLFGLYSSEANVNETMGTLYDIIITVILCFGIFLLGIWIYHRWVDPEEDGFSKRKLRYLLWYLLVIGVLWGLYKLVSILTGLY